MKKILVVLLMVCYNSFSQETCIDSIFYKQPLMEIMAKNNRRIVVRFNYKISESLRNFIFSIPLFNEKEKLIIQDAFTNSNYVPCHSTLEIVSKLIERPLDEKQIYISLTFSKPVFVSDKKAFIFYATGFHRNGYTGNKGGGSLMKIFQKQNGVWKETDNKILEFY